MSRTRPVQSPTEQITRTISFAKWADQRGLTLVSHVIVADDGITVVGSSLDVVNSEVQVTLTGGTVGTAYKVIARITASNGDKKEGLLKVRVR